MTILDLTRSRSFLGSLLGGAGGVSGAGDGNALRIMDLRFDPSEPQTTISIINTPVLINGSFIEDPGLPSAGFTFTAAGRITWPGPGTRRTFVTYNAYARTPVTGNLINTYLGLNGTVLPLSVVGGFPSIFRYAQYPFRWTLDLAPGDFIEMFIENATSTDNPFVGSQIFMVE